MVTRVKDVFRGRSGPEVVLTDPMRRERIPGTGPAGGRGSQEVIIQAAATITTTAKPVQPARHSASGLSSGMLPSRRTEDNLSISTFGVSTPVWYCSA